MPSGNTHTTLAISVAALSFGVATYLGYSQQGIAVATGIIVGDLWLSPDLDGAASNAKRRWGILKCIWRIYERFPHRHPCTHWPILADIIRLGYLALVALPFCAGVGMLHDGVQGAVIDTFWAIDQVRGAVMRNQEISLCVFAGLCAATALHGIADAAVSEGKKMVDYVAPKQRRRLKGAA